MAKKLAKKNYVMTKKNAVTGKASQKAVKGKWDKKIPTITKPYTKTELINCLVNGTEVPKKTIVSVLEFYEAVIHKHLRAGYPFSMPNMLKMTVVKKAATKSRKGINPFTGQPMVYEAKPARKNIKIKPLKKLKEVILKKIKEKKGKD